MRKEKKYIFRWVDKNGTELDSKVYEFANIKEARHHAFLLFAENRLDGCKKIKVNLYI